MIFFYNKIYFNSLPPRGVKENNCEQRTTLRRAFPALTKGDEVVPIIHH